VRESTGQKILRLGVAGDSDLAWLDTMPDVRVRHRRREYVEMQIPDESVAERVLQDALRRPETITLFEVTVPSLNDIFMSEVRGASVSEDDLEQVAAPSREGVLA
jgi:ABC-type uncharacterized transport system ATPase subunit